MFRRARRSLPRRDQVHDAHVIAPDSSKSAMAGALDPPLHVRNHKPSAPSLLELGRGTNA